MSGMSHLEPKFRGMRRNNPSLVKVEEKRLQKLLDFIDTRMQDQRSKLRRQIEDTQQTADEMEDRRHKATLQVLKNYFEVTSGRVKMNSQMNNIHEERMTGVLSEPSLATVPELDPEVLAKPRSMYDRITRSMDTSRLPSIAPGRRNMVTQSSSLPATMPNSTRSDDSTASQETPRSTPSNDSGLLDTVNDWNEPKPVRIEVKDRLNNKARRNNYSSQNKENLSKTRSPSPSGRSSKIATPGHDEIYNRGILKPTSKLSLYADMENETPRLGDIVASKRGLTRHSSLNRRSMKSNMSMSTVSLSELQPTRKQQAASKLKTALKTVRVPR